MTVTLAEHDKVYLGTEIKSRRDELGFTQVQVARLIHIDASVVALWEHDARPVAHVRLSALATALEMSVEDLLGGAAVDVDDVAQRYTEDPPEDPPEPPPPDIPPSTVLLAWCNSLHGCPGERRMHHHGPLPAWALGPMLVLPSDPAPWAPRERVSPPPAVRRQLVVATPVPIPPAPPPPPTLVRTCTLCGRPTPVSGGGWHEHLRSAEHLRAEAAAEHPRALRRSESQRRHDHHTFLGLSCKCPDEARS